MKHLETIVDRYRLAFPAAEPTAAKAIVAAAVSVVILRGDPHRPIEETVDSLVAVFMGRSPGGATSIRIPDTRGDSRHGPFAMLACDYLTHEVGCAMQGLAIAWRGTGEPDLLDGVAQAYRLAVFRDHDHDPELTAISESVRRDIREIAIDLIRASKIF